MSNLAVWPQLLDYLIAYESHTKPLMQMLDASGSLPCPEDIWEAPSVEKILVYDTAPGTSMPVGKSPEEGY